MILITGASGKTGQAITRALAAAGQEVRALVHRPEQMDRLNQIGARETLAGDVRLYATLEIACRGIQTIYHICPNVTPDEILIGKNVIQAAKSNGVQTIVYHSVLHPQVEAMPHHWLKMHVEELLFESGLTYTILQPCAYMQNILANWENIIDQGIYPVPYPIETRISMVDLEDVAAVATVVLTKPGHDCAIYELAGPQALSQTEVAKILNQQLRRPVQAEEIALTSWENQARTSGMNDYARDTLIKMFRYYAKCGFLGNPNSLTWLLDRPPQPLSDFITRTNQEKMDIPKR